MSIVAMVDNEVQRAKRGPARTTLRRPARRNIAAEAAKTDGSAPSQTSTGGVISSLVSYVPAEAIAAYVAFLPFMDPSADGVGEDSYSGRFALVGAVALLAILYAIGYRYLASLRASKPFKMPLLAIVTALVGFVAWVFALPDSPFNYFDFYSHELGATVGTFVATAIAFVGGLTEETLTYRKEAEAQAEATANEEKEKEKEEKEKKKAGRV